MAASQTIKKKRKASRQRRLGGSMVIPVISAVLASISLIVCTGMLIADPPDLPLNFFFRTVFLEEDVHVSGSDSAHTAYGLLPQTVPAADSYMDGNCYVGDSITYGMQLYGLSQPSCTFGYIGLNQESALSKQFVDLGGGRLLTMAEGVAQIKPKRVILLIGINSVAWMSDSDFKDSYQELVTQLKKASPDSTLILESMLPVTSYYETYVDSRINNDRIDSLNQIIQELAKKNSCYYLNTAEVFKATDGSADINYMNNDGMHITTNGYQLMLNYIRNHAVS